MTKPDLATALNDCIDRMNAGQPLDDCLRRYPQYAGELRSLLAAGRNVQRALPPSYEAAAARKRVRSSLQAALDRQPVRRASLWPRLAMAAALFLLCGAITGIGYAALIRRTAGTPTPQTIITLTPALTATDTPQPTPTITPSPTATATITASVTATATATHTRTPAATQTPSLTPTEAGCTLERPAGWVTYTVRAGDTLSALAHATGLTHDELMAANCLIDPDFIVVGQTLFLPFTPAAAPGTTPTATPYTDGGSTGVSSTPPPDGGNLNDNGNDNDHDDHSDDNLNDNLNDNS